MKLIIKSPLWTGDIDQRSYKIQPTGIMGSFRWWTEVLLRGLGMFVCDPTSDGRCPGEFTNKIKRYCPVCLTFGATGIRRAFKLVVSGGKEIFSESLNIKPSGRNKGWYLGSGIIGEINLEITPFIRDFDESLVLVPLVIASKWGGIGAKTQHGYGVVEIKDSLNVNFNQFNKAIKRISEREILSEIGIELREGSNNGLPDIKDMFFAKVQFEVTNADWWKEVDGISERRSQGRHYQGCAHDSKMISWANSGSVPISPAIKNWLRFGDGVRLWRTNNRNINRRIENWLFGTTKRTCQSCYEKVRRDRNNPQNFWCSNCNRSIRKEETYERISSKINISCAYLVSDTLWEFRIWGWLPGGEAPAGFDRESFLDNLKQALDGSGDTVVPWDRLLGNQTENHSLKVWREFNSARDTVNPNENNIERYIQGLLEG